MHFGTKSYLKSNRNHTAKQTLASVGSPNACASVLGPNAPSKGLYLQGEEGELVRASNYCLLHYRS